MEMYITSSVFASLVAASAFLYSKYTIKKQKAEALEKQNEELIHDIEGLNNRIFDMEAEQDEILAKKVEAETKFSSFKELLARAEEEKEQAFKAREAANENMNSSMREAELVKQRIKMMEEEMANWQKTKEQHLEAAKASILQVGTTLSSKLLEDHKRESEAAKKENEKIVKETTEDLQKKFQSVFESMNTLNENVKNANSTVDLVKRSLLSPGGAGNLAEITLENIFKNSGLIEGQDYQMQYWIEGASGKGSKPDAVVFLPGNSVMVIDSKASKFFIEIGDAEDESSQQKDLKENLKKSMNQHLKDLVERNYREVFETQTDKENVNIIMFLPTEVALEKLRKVDNNFIDKAWKERIIPVGPAGLMNLLLQAKIIISNEKQEQNSRLILAEVRELLSSVIKLHELAGMVGKGLRSAFTQYDKFAGSFNRNFLSKAKKIEKLGSNMPQMRKMEQLERYKIDSHKYKEIDGEIVDNEEENSEIVAIEELA